MSPVLIVDDSLTVRMDLDEAFVAAGFQTTLCADAAGAREALASGRFSLAVLDVLLPDGDGLELLVEMKSSPAHAGTPVVLLSSEVEVQHRVRGLRTGADEYVGKPYDAAQVVARARDLVRRRDGAEAAPRAPVLVVDDSATAREELRGALEAAGLDVVTAASGEEGLRAAAVRHPSAVVVDGLMPGMDGGAFVRQLRSDAVLRGTPCILLTASGALDELKALESGADAYLRKEEGNAIVVARLQALLRGSNGAAAAAAAAGLPGPKRVLALGGAPALRWVSEPLRREGHDVVEAASAAEALELMAVDRVDAVVVDAGASLDAALDACRALRASPAWRGIPLLVVGGADGRRELVAALDAGADDLVSATAGGEVLRARVAALLRRKQIEDENRAREAFARSAAILETIADAFFAVDVAWRIVYANHALEPLLGAPRAALVGSSLWERCGAAEAAFERELRRAAGDRVPATFEVQWDDRWLEVRAFPHEQGLSAHLRDVTDRHRSEEVQRHLLGIVGHDLRTPLTVVAVSAGTVLRDASLPERHRRSLQRVEGGISRMSRLIGDLLDYSRTRLGQGLPVVRRPAQLDALCREAIGELLTVHPERTIDYRPEGDGEGEWDAGRVSQVLMNLLTNAARYSPPDASITLSWRGGEEKVIAVHNDGPPIDPALLGRMFEPFKRGAHAAQEAGSSSGRGLGLGLYIVREIVRAHGGAVGVRSEQGAGTTFTVVLPARPG